MKCRVAGNTERFHMAGDVSYSSETDFKPYVVVGRYASVAE